MPENIQLIPVGLRTQGIDCSPDCKEVWVGSNEKRKIIVLITASNTQLTEVKAGAMPIRIKFSPNQASVLVSDLKARRRTHGNNIG